MEIDWPWIFLLLPPALVLAYFRRKGSFLAFPSLAIVPDLPGGRAAAFISRAFPVALLFLLLLLASGPRFPVREGQSYGYGADIVFLLDESGSMGEPFGDARHPAPGPGREAPTRFSAAKGVIARFMEKRKTGQDRYGLTAFGTSAVRVLPLTFNHALFLASLDSQDPVLQSTSFDYPLALGLDELMRSGARSRVLVLVSDGSGPLDDDRYGFSGVIRQYGIRFYWVSIGQEVFRELPRFLEKLGPLARQMEASDPAALEAGFEEIHSLERSLILYPSAAPSFTARPVAFAGLLLMGATWSLFSLAVYHRARHGGRP